MYDAKPRQGRLRRAIGVLGRPEVLLLVGLLAAVASLVSYLVVRKGGGPSEIQLLLLIVALSIYFRLSFKSAWG